MKDIYESPTIQKMLSIYQKAGILDAAYQATETPYAVRMAIAAQNPVSCMARNLELLHQKTTWADFIQQASPSLELYRTLEQITSPPSVMLMNLTIQNMSSSFAVSNFLKRYPKAYDVSEQLSRIWDESDHPIKSGSTVSAEGAMALVDEVKPYLPEEAAEAIEERIQSEKQSESKISWKTVMEIITFIICVLGFIKGYLPDEYQQKQEAANAAVIANQEEMIDLQKQEFKRSEEFRQRAEEHFEIEEEIYERIAQALETLADQSVESDQESQKLANLADLPDDSPEEKALNETGDTEN